MLAGNRAVNLEIKVIGDQIVAAVKRVQDESNVDWVTMSDDLATVMAAARGRKKAKISGPPAQLMLTGPQKGDGGRLPLPPLEALSPSTVGSASASTVAPSPRSITEAADSVALSRDEEDGDEDGGADEEDAEAEADAEAGGGE